VRRAGDAWKLELTLNTSLVPSPSKAARIARQWPGHGSVTFATGYQVFGTSRNPSTAARIPGVVMVALDVCATDSVAACVKTVLDQAGHLDALVNNAR
jgi:enoyl-[acyl-carrier-protein] reductase (NADH)